MSNKDKGDWIFIGELEGEPHEKVFYSDASTYLYAKSWLDPRSNTWIYKYALSDTGEKGIGMLDVYSFGEKYSINTILCFIISVDRDHGHFPDGVLIESMENCKIRLVGGEWIYPDKDFLHQRINLSDVEEKFRSKRQYKLDFKAKI